MLVAPKYNGLDLPVYDPDTFVATSQDFEARGVSAITDDYIKPAFVRAVSITLLDPSHAPDTMAKLLRNTERELEAIAEKCGGLVVRHEWGLYPVTEDPKYQYYRDTGPGWEETIELPENHILVAEVDAIRPSHAPTSSALPEEIAGNIRTGVEDYYSKGQGGYQLYDMRYDPENGEPAEINFKQFVHGTRVGAASDQSRTYLTDIDPRFALTRY